MGFVAVFCQQGKPHITLAVCGLENSLSKLTSVARRGRSADGCFLERARTKR